MDRILRAFVSRHCVRIDVNSVESVGDCPLFTIREFEKAVLTIENKEASGPDDITAEFYKLVFRQRSDLLLGAFYICLKEEIFPCRWKVTRIALISKGQEDPDLLSAYRPLCMPASAGKVQEKLIGSKLAEEIRTAGDLFPRQFGFRARRSAVDAVMEVVDAVHRAEPHSPRS